MIKSVHISTTEADCGKSLGLINLLLKRAMNVGIFRTMMNNKNKNLDLLITHLKLNLYDLNSYLDLQNKVFNLLNQNKEDEVIETIIER